MLYPRTQPAPTNLVYQAIGTGTELSQDLAYALGERDGRTFSRATSQTFSDLTGLSHDDATDVVHGLMTMAVAVPEVRKPIVAVLIGAFAIAAVQTW